MTTNQHIITALAAMAVLTMLSPSCGKTETENAYSQQDKNIESIVSSLAPEGSGATVEYFDGSVRVTVKQGEGEALEDNGSVSFYYAGHCVNSSSLSSGNMFVTNSKEIAESAQWTVSDTTMFKVSTVDLSGDKLVKGLRKGIVGVKSGDECYILFNGKNGFGKHKTGTVPGNSALAYHLWITDVTNK